MPHYLKIRAAESRRAAGRQARRTYALFLTKEDMAARLALLVLSMASFASAPCPFSGRAVGKCPGRAASASQDIDAEDEEQAAPARGRQLFGFPTQHDPYAGPDLLNAGKGCWGLCNRTAGPCAYCGAGSCCRQSDYDLGVPGCELANNITGARCGNWSHPVQDWLKNQGTEWLNRRSRRLMPR